ncbi:hypothetical protein QTN94_14300 [Vibrio sp. M250220]
MYQIELNNYYLIVSREEFELFGSLSEYDQEAYFNQLSKTRPSYLVDDYS